MKRLAAVALSVLFAVYPLAVYLGMEFVSASVLGAILLAVVGARMVLLLGLDAAAWKQFLPLFAAVGLIAGYSAAFNDETALLLVPFVANGVFFGLFSFTLWRGPTMIERFAALQYDPVPHHVQRYCRTVTYVWCAFFVANGAVALYSALFGSKEFWALYNGLISYVLIGALIAGEWIIRKRIQRREPL